MLIKFIHTDLNLALFHSTYKLFSALRGLCCPEIVFVTKKQSGCKSIKEKGKTQRIKLPSPATP
jgi:hypothetical protein